MTVTNEGLDLLAACVAANVDEAARVTNLLIDSERRRAQSFAEALINLADGLEAIPDMIRPVYVDRLLTIASPRVDAAQRFLAEDDQ